VSETEGLAAAGICYDRWLMHRAIRLILVASRLGHAPGAQGDLPTNTGFSANSIPHQVEGLP